MIDTGSFPLEWKKANKVAIHKRGDKQCLKNYRPISLLPICGKILERLIFIEMFMFLKVSSHAPKLFSSSYQSSYETDIQTYEKRP